MVRTTAEGVATKAAVNVAKNQLLGGDDAGFWALLAGLLVTLIIYLVIVAIFLAYVPGRTEAVRARLAAKPFSSLCLGFLFLSMLVGAVPVAAVTVVGIVFIPFILLAIFAACVLAYLVATYTMAWAVLSRIKPIVPSLLNKLLATAAGLVLLSLTHYLWFFGWIINLAVVLFGLGAIAAVCAKTMLARREGDAAEEAATLPPETAAADKPAAGESGNEPDSP
nr:hypothetical protein [Marinicella sp. W31]MDC2876297.1 hypothetical protein [Marinicella sp. W31]